jgi:iterative type I PKS product template protein
MEFLHPVVLPTTLPKEQKLLKVVAVADLISGKIDIEFTLNSEGQIKRQLNAKCIVFYRESASWLSKWSQSSYLVRDRIKSLVQGLNENTTQKFLRGMAYRLFSSFVEYDRKFQGMEEVLINTDEFEAVATLSLYLGSDAGSFFCSPLWIDSLIHLSGFILNATSSFDSQSVAFISHGWKAFRLARDIDPLKRYRVHVKMQPTQESIYAGNISIFDGDTQIGIVKGVKFQQIPRSLINSLLPSANPSTGPASSRTTFISPRQLEFTPTQPLTSDNIERTVLMEKKQSPNTSRWDDILQVIIDETGIHASQLLPETMFSSLGIDSLSSLTIISQLQEKLQMEFPQTLFEDYTTIGDLHHHFACLSDASSDNKGSLTPTSSEEGMSSNSVDSLLSYRIEHRTDNSLKIAKLRAIVAGQLGLSVDELLISKNLSEVGMDSLMSLTTAGIIRDVLQISVPSDVFERGQTMDDVEKALDLTVFFPPEKALPSETNTSSNVEMRIPTSVCIQGSTSSAADILFLFPDGSGSASSYTKLQSISSKLCIIGLNSPFLHAGPTTPFSINDAVQLWVQEIRRRQPHGPYNLGGWSAGGYYAFEAAKRLMREGDEVHKLIFIDTPPRNVYEAMPLDVLDWLQQENLMGKRDDGSKAAPTPTWLFEHFRMTLVAVDQYRPTPLETLSSASRPEVYLIWASNGVLPDHSDHAFNGVDFDIKVSNFLLRKRQDFGPNGWDKLVPGCKLSIAKAPGSHFSMVLPPNVSFRPLQPLHRLLSEKSVLTRSALI